MPTKLTTEFFIDKARKIHGNKYDYSKVIYVNSLTKVIITCPEHGDFYQRPSHHLDDHGCNSCGGSNKSTIEDFIQKAKSIHGSQYDYSKTIYKQAQAKLIITCKIHGDFKQKPANHLYNYRGCPSCGLERKAELRKSNTEEFLKKVRDVHKDKFVYSLVEYLDCKTKVKIICSTHGIFEQTPSDHLAGRGCPRCKESKGEALIAEILKRNNIDFTREYKIPKVEKEYEYDFYLKDHNLLIEFHGIQHYERNKFFHRSEEKFRRQLTRDDEKREYAKVWRYGYLEIKYSILQELSVEEFERRLMKYIQNAIK